MNSLNKFRLAGIVSVISICGVLAVEIVGNVVGDYLTEQLRGWQGSALTSTVEAPATETAAEPQEAPAETAGSVTLPVAPPSASETVVRAAVGDPQAVQTQPAPQSGPAPHEQQGASVPAEPLPAQEAAPAYPQEDLAVPGQGNWGANRAALKQRVNKWRAQRMRRANKRWNAPQY